MSANKYVCVVVRDRDYGSAHTVCQRRLTGHGSHGTETAHRSREPGRCFLFEIGPCTWESCGAQLFQLTNTLAQLQGGSGVTTAGHGRARGNGTRCLRRVERAVQSRRGTGEGGRCRRRPRGGVGPLRASSLTLIIDRLLCFKHKTRGSQGALGLPPPLVSPPRSTGVWETSEAVSLGAYHMDLLDLVGARAHGF